MKTLLKLVSICILIAITGCASYQPSQPESMRAYLRGFTEKLPKGESRILPIRVDGVLAFDLLNEYTDKEHPLDSGKHTILFKHVRRDVYMGLRQQWSFGELTATFLPGHHYRVAGYRTGYGTPTATVTGWIEEVGTEKRICAPQTFGVVEQVDITGNGNLRESPSLTY